MFNYIVLMRPSYGHNEPWYHTIKCTENRRPEILKLIEAGTNVTDHLEGGYIEELGTDHDCLVDYLKHYRDDKTIEDLFIYRHDHQLRRLVEQFCDACLVNLTIEDVYGMSLSEMKKILLNDYWCVVTRSYKPEQGIPWKQVGRRSYLWCVPAYDADKDAGRRIEWGGDTTMFASKREALKFMYND